MSRLGELIRTLCPDGVEFKPIWEMTIWDKKFNAVDRYKQKKVIKYNYLLAADLKSYVVEGGDVKLLTTYTSNLYTTEELASDLMSEGEIVSIPWGGNLNVQYYKGKFLTADNRIATSKDTSVLSNKFLYYLMLGNSKELSSFYRGSGIKHPDMSKVLDMEIPIPPMEVQEEIVRILDKFTALEAELEAELEARKKQYEHYRDTLLSFTPPVSEDKWVIFKRLGDVCDMKGRIGFRGYTRNDLVEESEGAISLSPSNIIDGQLSFEKCSYISWFKYNESPEIMAEVGDIVFTKTASVGKTALIKTLPKETTINPQLVLLKRISCDPAYLSHVLRHSKFQTDVKMLTGVGSVPNVSQTALANIVIPIPPLSEQKRIAGILDKFEAICTDLCEGLPAEIEARRRQYEHYRDRLLSFRRKSA